MDSEKPQPEPSRGLARKVARIAFGVTARVLVFFFVFGLVVCVSDAWHHRKRPWRWARDDIGRLVTLVEIVKAVQQVDRDNDARLEYVGWRDYVESVLRASPEKVRSIEHELFNQVSLTGISLEGLRTRFILDQKPVTMGEYEVQTGRYLGRTRLPQFDLALFVPTDPDRAERIWILVAQTDEKAWFQTLKSFLIVKNEGDLSFHFGKNFPMDSDSRLPDIERLGSFQPGHVQGEEVWRPYPLPE